MTKIKLLIIGLLFSLLLIGCAKQVTDLNPAGSAIKITVHLNSTITLDGGALLVAFHPTNIPQRSIDVNLTQFTDHDPYWYGRGPNEINDTDLDNLLAKYGRNYLKTDDYFTSVFTSWSDYVYISALEPKIVQGPFPTSANIPYDYVTLTECNKDSNSIYFSVNANYLNGGFDFSEIRFNVFSLNSDGIIKDYLESDPSPIEMKTTYASSESDSDTKIGSPTTGNILSWQVYIE